MNAYFGESALAFRFKPPTVSVISPTLPMGLVGGRRRDFPGGLIAQRAGDEGFADAGRAGHQQRLVLAHPAATRQIADQRAVEAARQSRSSRQAVWRSRARFSRLARAVLARSAVSRSTSRASWSSKLSWLRSGWRSRSSRPRAMPYRRRRRNASWVGCFMVSGLRVQFR